MEEVLDDLAIVGRGGEQLHGRVKSGRYMGFFYA
jgi:hypothetical protein